MPLAFPWLFTVGALTGLGWLAWGRLSDVRSSRPEADGRIRFDAGVAALAGGLILSRAGFVALHIPAFAGRWEEVLWLWTGGLSGPAGIAGGLAGLWLFTRAGGRPFWPLADELAAPALLLAAVIWLGCALDGCAYGAKADMGWWTPAAPDAFGASARRFPVQPAGMLLSLAALAVLVVRRRGWPTGRRAIFAVAAASATLVVLSFWRADPAVIWLGMRAEAWGGLALLGVSLTAGFVRGRRLSSA
jgi:prolipoprotein diacylglyceryltransferase